MNSFVPRLLTLFLLGLLLHACDSEGDGGTPPPAQPRVERPSFSGLTAHALIRQQVAFGPRVPGTEGHARQLVWMDSILRATADSVERQTFTYVTSRDEELTLTNLLARFHPEAQHRILLLAHWDTRPWADEAPSPQDRATPVPGANDGASGTAILLHLAEILAQEPPPSGVDLLFTDGEDYGPEIQDMLLGAKYFASALPSPIPWSYGILLDLVGDLDPNFPMEAYSVEFAPALTQRIWRVARELGYGDFFPQRVGVRAIDDHVPLNEAGLPTVNIIDFEYGPGNRLWHTLQDTPENTSPETLQMVGEVVAELIYRGG